MSEITIRPTTIKSIPVLEVFLDDTGVRPLCLLFHGVTAHKEFMLKDAYFLSQRDLHVVVPDCPMHGERNPEKQEFETIDVVLAASAEIDKIIDHYSDEDMVDHQRTGIVGISMGGFIVYHYITNEDRKCKAAAAIVSTPDWASIGTTDSAKKRPQERNVASADIAKTAAMINEIQPINNYVNIPQIPLLMMNGSADPFISVEGPRNLYDKLYPLYENKENLKFEICEGVSHFVTTEMDNEIGNWMARHLTQ